MGRLKRGTAPLCPPVQVRLSEDSMKALEKIAGPYQLPKFIRDVVEAELRRRSETKTPMAADMKRLRELVGDGQPCVDAIKEAIRREVKRLESKAIKPKPKAKAKPKGSPRQPRPRGRRLRHLVVSLA